MEQIHQYTSVNTFFCFKNKLCFHQNLSVDTMLIVIESENSFGWKEP